MPRPKITSAPGSNPPVRLVLGPSDEPSPQITPANFDVAVLSQLATT
jgi:hypothetical protein